MSKVCHLPTNHDRILRDYILCLFLLYSHSSSCHSCCVQDMGRPWIDDRRDLQREKEFLCEEVVFESRARACSLAVDLVGPAVRGPESMAS